MTTSRMFLAAALLMCGLVALPTRASAQSAGAQPAVSSTSAPAVEPQWTPVKCGTCEKAGVTLELNRSPKTHGADPAFTVARVRNLTQREVKGSIDVLSDELPDSEGYTRSQTLWFVLSPLGNEKGEQLVLLPYSLTFYAVAHDVEQW